MYQLDLSNNAKDLKDNEIENACLAEILADNISMSEGLPNAVKFWDIASSLYKDKKVSLDESDFNMLKDFVKHHHKLKVLIKAQIEKSISKAERDNELENNKNKANAQHK